MGWKRPFCVAGGAMAVALLFSVSQMLAADLPPAPPLSTLVPADDLVGQVESCVEELESCVESKEEYDDSAEKLERYSNTLAVIALAIGLHDQNSKLKQAAPGLVKAAQELAAAKDFASARAGVAKVKAAMSSTGNPATLRWAKVASLHALMEQVPLVNTRMKRYISRHFDRGAPLIAGYSASLVAISQASMANADETTAPDKVAEWYKYCLQMRDGSAALNKAAHAKNEEAAKAAMAILQQSCEDCHAVFHNE